MKTLRTMMMGLALFVICGAARADKIYDGKLTQTYAINTYVDAMTRGKVAGLNDVLDKTAEFSMLRGKTVMSYTKKDMLNYFNENKNIEQSCTTSTSVVESNDNIAIVKVSMKFADFTRSNYVTVANTGNGWKITHVYSTFK